MSAMTDLAADQLRLAMMAIAELERRGAWISPSMRLRVSELALRCEAFDRGRTVAQIVGDGAAVTPGSPIAPWSMPGSSEGLAGDLGGSEGS